MIGASRLKKILSGAKPHERIRTPGFYDLTPADAFPWHELVCPNTSNALLETLKGRKVIENPIPGKSDLVPISRSLNLGLYPLNTFQTKDQPGYWNKIGNLFVESPTSNFIKKTIDELFESMQNDSSGSDIVRKDNTPDKFSGKLGFKPRSRIVIDKQ